MRSLLPVLAIVVIVAAPAAAQTKLEDGVRALIESDYTNAVRILKPLAENGAASDPTAQFFMAVLYVSGHGVEPDLLRACALFASAAKPANPLMESSSALASSMREQMGPGAAFCESGGSWRDVPPMSFTLGPDHRVDITPTSFTVRYNGTESRIHHSNLPGMKSLPARYTPILVTRPAAARRHFIEYFIWAADVPSAPSSWTLGWILSEVVGAEVVSVIAERNLTRVESSSPPESFAVEKFARVRVNGDGEAEWEISNGMPRRGVIPWRGPR